MSSKWTASPAAASATVSAAPSRGCATRTSSLGGSSSCGGADALLRYRRRGRRAEEAHLSKVGGRHDEPTRRRAEDEMHVKEHAPRYELTNEGLPGVPDQYRASCRRREWALERPVTPDNPLDRAEAEE